MEELYSNYNYKCFKNLIGVFVKNGKKVKALNYILFALSELHKQTEPATLLGLMQILTNIIPIVSFRKLGKRKVFYLPKIINIHKGIRISLSWIKKCAVERTKPRKKIKLKLAKDLVDAYYNKGAVVEKKNILYRLLLEGRPFLYILRKWRLTDLEISHIIGSIKRKEKFRGKEELKVTNLKL